MKEKLFNYLSLMGISHSNPEFHRNQLKKRNFGLILSLSSKKRFNYFPAITKKPGKLREIFGYKPYDAIHKHGLFYTPKYGRKCASCSARELRLPDRR